MIEFLRDRLTMEQINDFIPAVNSHGDKHGYTNSGGIVMFSFSDAIIEAYLESGKSIVLDSL